MSTFTIISLGCKVNTYESESYTESLIKLGYQVNDENPDICIINSCTVTNTAAAKSRQKIHYCQKKWPNSLICVVGCLAQTEDLRNENIDVLIGAKFKNKLAEYVDRAYKEHISINVVDNIEQPFSFEKMEVNSYVNQTRAFLKIQDGCNQFCSYCTIPLARGKERSLELNEVIDEANKLVANNHKEIVLTGIHTGRYYDQNGKHLIDVLKALLETKVERIRISSIEITEITDEIIELIKNNDRLARHLHIPLQSGSSIILNKMNRPYDQEYFIKRIKYIKKEIPHIAIGTDIIVGFPNESEDDFNETIKVVDEADLDYLHVFPYSLRKNTVAEKIGNHINGSLKKERCKKLINIGENKKTLYLKSFIGCKTKVLFEKKIDEYWYGHNSEYCEVKVKSAKNIKGLICDTMIQDYDNGILVGVICDEIK